jgi:hypothetical protein
MAGEPQRLITLTGRRRDGESAGDCRGRLGTALVRLTRRIRRRGWTHEYLAVWELTRAGTPHVHVLQRGDYIPQRWLSAAWARLTGCPVVDIRQITSARAAAGYVTKYGLKGAEETQAVIRPRRLISRSRKWVVVTTPYERADEAASMVWAITRTTLLGAYGCLERMGYRPEWPGSDDVDRWELGGGMHNWRTPLRETIEVLEHLAAKKDAGGP